MAHNLSAKIKSVRQSLGLDQGEFGDRVGASQSAVARWEGGSMPKGDALNRIASIAGTTVEQLLGSESKAVASVSNRLRSLRKAAGLTQGQLAVQAGTTKNQLVKLESGARRLSDHWAARLAPHLGVEPYELFKPADAKRTMGEILRELQGRSGLSYRTLAVRGGYKHASSVQRYFDATFDVEFLDIDVARKLAQAFTGTPVAPDEVMALTGIASLATFQSDQSRLGAACTPDATMVHDVVLRLLELEGLQSERAEAVAQAVAEALRLVESLPDEGDPRTRARLAAQAVWQIGLR